MTTEPHSSASAERRLSILLVDDEPTIRLVLRRYFARAGWEVDEAEGGVPALAKVLAPEAAYDVVLCDLRMPDLSGAEVYRRLAQQAPRWAERVMLASGDAASPEAAALLGEVRCRLVEKPFVMSELLALATEIATRGAAAGR